MRRFVAGSIDLAASLLLAILLAPHAGWFLAERAVVTLRIYDPASAWNGPIPLILGNISPLTYGWPLAWLLVTAGEAIWGAGPGKLATGLVVVPGPGAGRGAPGRRWLVKGSGALLVCLGLLVGWWPLGLAGVVAGGIVLLGAPAALTAGGTTLPDRLSGTSVARRPRGIATLA